MKKFKLIVLIAVIVLTVIIFMQNSAPITFNILFWEIYASKIIAFLIILVIGFIIGLLFRFLMSKKG